MTWRLVHSVRAPGPLKTRKLSALGVRTLCIAKSDETGRATTLHVQDSDCLKSVVPLAVNVVSNVRPLLFASLLAVTSLALPAIARADCAVAPLGSTDDLVVSFLAAQGGTQAAASTQFASPVKEGMLVYDDTTNALRYCDGTNWVSLVGSGGGGNATAAGTGSEVQFRNSSTGAFNADANFVWDDTNDRLGIGTATPGTTLHILGNAASARMSLTAPVTANALIDMQSKGTDGLVNTAGNKGWRLNVRGDQHSNTPMQNAFSFDYYDGTTGYNYFSIMPNGAVGMGAVPAASALMDLTSTTRGFLPPRMTAAQRDAIASPATGLVVYNTDDNALNYWDGDSWEAVGTGASGSGSGGIWSAVNTGHLYYNGTTVTMNDIPGMSVTFNLPTSTTVLLLAEGGIRSQSTNGGGGSQAGFRFVVDGTPQGHSSWGEAIQGLSHNPEHHGTWVISRVVTLPAGSHTIKVQASIYGDLYVCAETGGSIQDYKKCRLTVLAVGAGSGSGSSTLAGLTDVDTSAAANGKALVYNSTTSKWEAQTISGGGAGTAPGFFVHKNNVDQTVTASSYQKLTWNTEVFDIGNNFASDRFTPTVAGRYVFSLNVYCNNTPSYCHPVIYKNGTQVAGNVGGSSSNRGVSTSAIVDMNGTTDYVEAYVYNYGTNVNGNPWWTNFSGSLVTGFAASGSSQWTTAGSDIHYGTGGVAVGQAAAPEATAALEIESTSKGFLPPRMTTAQRNAISSPATGLTIYNTTTNSLDFFNGTVWSSGALTSLPGSKGLSISGTVTSASATTFNVSAVTTNTLLGSNPTTSAITIPEAGNYFMTAVQNTCTGGANGYGSVTIKVNGATRRSANSLPNSCDSATVGLYAVLAAGDTVAAECGQNNAVSTTCYFDIAKLQSDTALGGGGSSQWTTAGNDIHYGTGGVAVGQAAAPEATAALEVESTTKGFLPPRMTQVQRDAITSPAEGLVVYNTTTKSLDLRVASSWLSFGSSMTGNTMVPGWPDAILCNTTTPNFGTTFFYINISPGGDGRTYYRVASNTVGDYYIGFNTDGTYYAAGSTAVTTNCGTSIGALYSAGRAFNFIGGATASADGSAGQIQFNEGGNLKADAALHWDNTNKRLGIGTATPSSKLEIAGQDGLAITGYEPFITLRDTNASNLRALVQSKAGDLYLVPNSFIGGTPPVVIKTSTGNVGIGTAGPSAKLHVSSSGPDSILLDANTGGSTPWVASYLHLNGNIDYRGRGMLLTTAAAEAGASWFVGVPYTGGGFQIGNSNAHNVVTANNPSVTTQAKLFIASSGNVGIGTASPGYTLHVNGTAYATGAAGALSDVRHKKDVKSLKDGALELIGKLRPVSFQWKDPRDDGMKGEQFGFIAQEVEKILPQIVLTQNDEDKTKGLKPTELIPVLTKAIQELKADNDNLRKALKAANDNDAAQDAALEELRGEIQRLKAAR